MIELTDITQKECAAEILLEAKGFADVVVSISGDVADVIVQADDLTEAKEPRSKISFPAKQVSAQKT